MEPAATNPKRKRSIKKTFGRIIGLFLILLVVGAVFLYYNFNRLLSEALTRSFNSSSISDVYELNFKRLNVNFLTGNVSVHEVDFQPREKPLHHYPYINSSFRLRTSKMLLGNVQLLTLLQSNILQLDKIEIATPNIDCTITNEIPIFFPFNDTTVYKGQEKKSSKKSIASFLLKEFNLVDASLHVSNLAKEREFNIQQFNISLRDLLIKQQPGKDVFSYKKIELSIGKSEGALQKLAIRNIRFKEYKLTIDSLRMQRTSDTIIFQFADFNTVLNELDIQTADSVFHISMEKFGLSYREKSIQLKGVSFKPNVSDAALQAGFRFQHTLFSGSVGTLNISGINFDTLIHSRKIFINDIVLDNVMVNLFKDRTKPMDVSRFPEYLGQTIKAIPQPVLVKHLRATNVNLVNREKKPDGTYAKANINRATVKVNNITNISHSEMLVLNADAFLENKAHFNVSLHFNYQEPQFRFDGRIDKFNLSDLNPLIQGYTPASINKGVLDEIVFSGTASRTHSTGTMKFLYHDLDIDLKLHDKAKWKSSAIAFAANAALPAANPASATMPPRVVEFHTERDMNKSFVNVVIKSLLMGLKETMVMSKENRKTFHAEKRNAKKEARKKRRKEKNDK